MPSAVLKPVLPPLQTPKTASFPSEIVETPLSACLSAVIKQEQGLKTPITPPTAYTEFLKALTPVLASPPISALPRSLSDDSTQTINSTTSTTSSFTSKSDDHKSPISQPPTPFRRNPSHLRRLRIPHSPASAYPSLTSGPSPRTLSSLPSSILFSPYSPADWSIDSATRKTLRSTPQCMSETRQCTVCCDENRNIQKIATLRSRTEGEEKETGRGNEAASISCDDDAAECGCLTRRI